MRKKPLTSASVLPERLRYLQPFRRKFASRPPEELNEDSGGPPLMALFSKRIRGLSLEDAEALLEQDRVALEQWLAALDPKGDPLHFASGFFLIAPPKDIAKLIQEEIQKPPEPKLCLHVELPPGAKLRRVAGSGDAEKLVIYKGLWLGIGALPEQAVENLAAPLGHYPGRGDYSVVPVDFGAVRGRKFVMQGESWRGAFKQIAYALIVPGGHVYGSISAVGKNTDELNWDETPFEICFHTLRVETRSP